MTDVVVVRGEGRVPTSSPVPPKQGACKGAVCPAFAICQGRCALPREERQWMRAQADHRRLDVHPRAFA